MPVQRLDTKQWITARADQSVAFFNIYMLYFRFLWQARYVKISGKKKNKTKNLGTYYCAAHNRVLVTRATFSPAESLGGCRAAGPALEVVPDPGGVRSPEGAAGGAAPELSQPAGLLHQPADTQHTAAGDRTAQLDFRQSKWTNY